MTAEGKVAVVLAFAAAAVVVGCPAFAGAAGLVGELRLHFPEYGTWNDVGGGVWTASSSVGASPVRATAWTVAFPERYVASLVPDDGTVDFAAGRCHVRLSVYEGTSRASLSERAAFFREYVSSETAARCGASFVLLALAGLQTHSASERSRR